MIKIPHKWKFEWDYEGYPKKEDSPYTQKDWNQTLITRINQTSANIHKASLTGGADTIRLNSRMFNIIETLEYYNLKGDGKLTRFNVVVDDLILRNVIYVYNARTVEDGHFVYVPKITETKTSGNTEITFVGNPNNNMVEVDLGEIAFVKGTKKEIKKFKKSLIGKITIKNYEI